MPTRLASSIVRGGMALAGIVEVSMIAARPTPEWRIALYLAAREQSKGRINMFEVNWLAIIAAAVMGFLVGGLWYGPIMGKKWMGAVGLTEEQIKGGNMALIYGGAFAFSLIGSWTLAHTFASYAEYGADLSFFAKVMTAFGVALGFIVPAIGTNYLFSQKGKALFFIDAAYWLLFYIAMGCVHAWIG